MIVQTNTTPLRVLHLPCRSPYARKLTSRMFKIVNGEELRNHETIPYNLTFEWLCNQQSHDFFDVLHIHSIEFSTLEVIEQALARCMAANKRVVFTAHDVSPMFHDKEETYREKMRKVCGLAKYTVVLTRSSADVLVKEVPLRNLESRLVVIPHGFVIRPDEEIWGKAGSTGKTVEYALLGAFRPNRDTFSLLLNWYYGLIGFNVRLNILTRAVNPRELDDPDIHLRDIFNFIQSDKKRFHVVMHPFAPDEQVNAFLSRCDIILMPYRWGSHSGQLELAFDLNLLPVISDVGFYAEQWSISGLYVPEPLWFNWSDENTYNYGARFINALLVAQERIMKGERPKSKEGYRQFRLKEHDRLLETYLQVYTG